MYDLYFFSYPYLVTSEKFLMPALLENIQAIATPQNPWEVTLSPIVALQLHLGGLLEKVH